MNLVDVKKTVGVPMARQITRDFLSRPALIDKACVDPRRAEHYPPPALEPLTDWSVGLDWGFIHPAGRREAVLAC